jgi:hypothetical protein
VRDGIEVVKGDLDDESSLRRGSRRRAGRGAGQASWTLAREAGVEQYVYTSVGSAHQQTGVPHFDSKWRIERACRTVRVEEREAHRLICGLLDRVSEPEELDTFVSKTVRTSSRDAAFARPD